MLRYACASAVVAGTLMLGAVSPGLAAGSDDNGWGWFGWRHGPMTMMQGRRDGRMMGGDWSAMIERMDGRLAYIRAELKITDTQTPQWEAFAAAVRAGAEAHNALMQSMHEAFTDGGFDKMTLPERLAFQQTHLEARLEQVKATRDAADKLYGVLNEDQKKVADDIVLPMTGMGPGMMSW
jgi:hypothetical protein